MARIKINAKQSQIELANIIKTNIKKFNFCYVTYFTDTFKITKTTPPEKTKKFLSGLASMPNPVVTVAPFSHVRDAKYKHVL